MVKAIFFDVFGTVIDWRKGLAHGFERAFAKSGREINSHALADAWYRAYRARVRDPLTQDARGDEVAGMSLRDVLEAEGLERVLGDKDMAQLGTSWQRLPPWPDSVPGLRALRREYVIAPCTDIPTSTMTWLAKHAGLPWDLILGDDLVDSSGQYDGLLPKAAQAIGLEPGEVMFASAHNADLAAARGAGLKTAFFSRPKEFGAEQKSDLAPEDSWQVVAFDLLDLARHMESAIY